MPRRHETKKYALIADPVYNSDLAAQFINNLMKQGKKSVAQRILYDSFAIIEEKLGKPPLEVFNKALDNVKPELEVKSRRVGGATYQVPVEVRPERRVALAIRWLISFARAGHGRSMSEKLADEFCCILTSYMQPDGNYLEHPTLQRGVLWGVGRLAHARPRLLKESVDYLYAYMQAGDPYLRGLAAWAAGPLRNKNTEPNLKRLTRDDAKLSLFLEGQLITCSVGELAQKALTKF